MGEGEKHPLKRVIFPLPPRPHPLFTQTLLIGAAVTRPPRFLCVVSTCKPSYAVGEYRPAVHAPLSGAPNEERLNQVKKISRHLHAKNSCLAGMGESACPFNAKTPRTRGFRNWGCRGIIPLPGEFEGVEPPQPYPSKVSATLRRALKSSSVWTKLGMATSNAEGARFTPWARAWR